MDRTDETPRSNALPQEFVEQVKLALEHLYDLPFLQRHPFTIERDEPPGSVVTESPAQRLRSELLLAIEALSPGPGVTFGAPHARVYQSLQLHYVEGLSMQEVALELGLSTRQVYRDLHKGEEGVAAVLWPRYRNLSATPPAEANVTSPEAEIEHWELRPKSVDIGALLRYVQSAVEPLAQQRGVTLYFDGPPQPAAIFTDSSVAQQVLISLSSHAIKQAAPGTCTVVAGVEGGEAQISVRYTLHAERMDKPDIPATTQELMRRLGWSVDVAQPSAGERVIALDLASSKVTILVIDDNQGLVDLVSRFLSSYACQVTPATSGEQGLHLAQALRPAAILLDVMMPAMDGWEVLQSLRNHPHTGTIPVVICSVFNDPDLAYSLGADRFLAKPITRENLVDALHLVGVI